MKIRQGQGKRWVHLLLLFLITAVLATACSQVSETSSNLPLGTEDTTQESSEGIARLVEGDRFIVYYGSVISTRLAELQGPSKYFPFYSVSTQDYPYHAVSGPLSALDGKKHDIDMSSAQGWQFLTNLQLFDGTKDIWTRVAFSSGMAGLKGNIQVAGLPDPGSKFSVSYKIIYNGTNPLLGGDWDFQASTASAALNGQGAWK